MAEQKIGPYRIVRPIGKGGMGRVYLAVNDKEKQKVLLPGALDKEQSFKRIEGAGSYKMIFYNEED